MIAFGEENPRYESTTSTNYDCFVLGLNKQSYFACTSSSARFHGHLDIKTLGGAGFASQRTTGDSREWDLADYDGIELIIDDGDKKQYTFILKDDLLPPDPDTGREQSTISYEYDFHATTNTAEDGSLTVYIPWKEMKATYRGKEKKDAPSINLKKVRRLSLMIRRCACPHL